MFMEICMGISVLFIIIKIWFYITVAHCKSKVCLVGKTALVTGGSAGVGYEIVLGLASRGCRVIIADKNVDQSIKEAIIKETHNPNIVLKYVDFTSFKSIRELAENLKSSEKVIDILMNNAGIGRNLDSTEDNLNVVMQVNYYSGFLLTHLLVDLLKKSTSARIIFTSSDLCFLHTISLKRILPEKIEEGSSKSYYCDSKFLQIVASDIFAKKLSKFKITSNSFHPYLTKTTIFRSIIQDNLIDYLSYYVLQLFLYIFGQTAQDGAQTGIYLACANEIKEITGQFFGATIINPKPRGTLNSKLCEAIWKCSENVVKLQPTEKL